jgi:dihydrolipoamide dehydrogenase
VSHVEVRVPDIGDFAAVDVIEVHVKVGDVIAPEDPLITLETDKATMDVPAPQGGTVRSVAIKEGAKVSAGDLVLTLEAGAAVARPAAAKPAPVPAASAGAAPRARAPASAPRPAPSAPAPATYSAPAGKRLAVIGAGPGGYTAAFRAADLGLEVTLVER